MNPAQSAVAAAIVACERPLLCSHIRLDGDAIGSEAGLAHILSARGKRPGIVNDGPVPLAFHFLAANLDVGTGPGDLRDDYDAVIILDVALGSRLGKLAEALPRNLPIIVIDHHPAEEPPAGDICWTDSDRGSVGEMLFQLARDAGWRIPPEAATALYASIISDTGRFSYPNTNAAVIRAAAELIERGADFLAVARNLYQSIPLNLARLRGAALANIRVHRGGRVAVAHVSQAMFREFSVNPIDTHDFAEIPRAVAGVEVGAMLREKSDGSFRASLRGTGKTDVRAIAALFGGGGHHDAAGCDLQSGLAAAEKQIVAAIARQLDQEEKSSPEKGNPGEQVRK